MRSMPKSRWRTAGTGRGSAAVLAVGAAKLRPVVRDGEPAVGTVLHVTLSVGHRPIDGTVAAEWLSTFISLMRIRSRSWSEFSAPPEQPVEAPNRRP
ncbi:2-oxo acid dehydrogenase subunit E2 [Actinomadura sp. 3N508]|uniref:2-oxo acid dehydrogenase subunit E2 n=1 Tax=Actinomadura sp. 3N508 TaxID=3375153 RepID=UPI0037BCDFD1